MNFTAQELRNGKNALLRRVQRQLDVDNELKSITSDGFGKIKSKDKNFFEPKEKKQTRLHLMKRRYDKF